LPPPPGASVAVVVAVARRRCVGRWLCPAGVVRDVAVGRVVTVGSATGSGVRVIPPAGRPGPAGHAVRNLAQGPGPVALILKK
jgi:hypothetical protein